MKVTKIGHCCLIIEDGGTRILTDPGIYTTAQNDVKNVDYVVITHEHGDHLHLDSLKALLNNNPSAMVISNSAVQAILAKKNIKSELVEDGQSKQLGEILIEGLGTKHAEIFEEYGQVLNTGYFFSNKLFYPGDALYNPNRQIDTLAFPTPGSWANMKQSISYVLELKPRLAFPVHDGAFANTNFMYQTFSTLIPPRGVEVIIPELKKQITI
jgi:L-ascorbate metabolism protein UlaG (beta-lactamase superfamily)